MHSSKYKDEDSDSPHSLDKAAVLQQARAFNEAPINARKCRTIITHILRLLHSTQAPLTPVEATDLFFSITKLFQSKDIPLRQMVYLVIKELSTIANDVIMVTSSLTKDINSTADVVYKPNAIRALCKITDGSMLQSIERFLKQSIVSQNPSISSAALCSSLHLFTHVPGAKEVIKRWINEVSESLQKPGITQYHALGLMYNLKKEDKVGVVKMLMALAKSVKSPFAICVLVRVARDVVAADLEAGGDGSKTKPIYNLLETWLRHKSDMVVYEAARSICTLPSPSTAQLFPAVSALQLLLLNHKPTLRFAAIRTLNKLAMTHPVAVWPCNLDMENLISDTNRSIATFAITTLLKTGTEASVDRLMKQISGFMSEISEEFKIIVIDAIRSLCLKFPSKQVITLNFLSGVLRDEGGYEFKRSIVEAIFDIIWNVEDSREFALSHLCEFIEDCEFTKLSVRILHLIGTIGPTTPNPSKYIRYIYNRVILENATTRAAAVSALASFAVRCPGLKGRISVLLQRCLDDVDDEVRDRAVFYLGLLEKGEGRCEKFIEDDSVYSWSALEHNIIKYLSDPTTHSAPFDISSTPIITKDQEQAETLRAKTAIQENIGQISPSNPVKPSITSPITGNAFDAQTLHAQTLDAIPELAKLGNVFKSGKVVELTESETEYVVGCIKHIYEKFVVFQFTCKNTRQECVLENVTVSMEMQAQDEDEIIESGARLTQLFTLPAKKLEYEVPASLFVVWEIKKSKAAGVALGCFSNVLEFKQREVDVTTGELEEDGFDDEYLLEDLELGLCDYVQPLYVSDFRKSWEEFGRGNEAIETYSLTAVQGVKAAVTTLISLLGMQPCEQTQNIANEKATTHTLLVAGTFIGGVKVLVRCRIAYDPGSGVTLEIGVRGADRGVCDRVANCIQ